MPKDRSTHLTKSKFNPVEQAPQRPPLNSGPAPGQPNPAMANWGQLLLRLLPGFLPLLVYIIAEALWGDTVGLIVAISFGIGEFLFLLIRDRRPDWLSAMDTLLLVLMGGISLAFNAPVFFRIKPALVEFLMAILLGLSAFGTRNLVMGRMLGELRKTGMLTPAAEARLAGMIAGMFWLVLGHALLTVFAALWLDKVAWEFISGGLFYLLFGVWALAMVTQNLLRSRRR